MSRIIGIAGGSGSGKTTLARVLAEALGPQSCAILSQDHYYIDQSARFDGDGGSVNFDHPSSLEFTLLAQHLSELNQGRAVAVPRYDYATHSRKKETELFVWKPYVLVEGTLILSQEIVRPHLEVAVFIEASETVRFQRRLRRDVRERGRTPEGVRKQFDLQVKPMHDQFVEPSRSFADLVVSGEIPVEQGLAQLLEKIRSL